MAADKTKAKPLKSYNLVLDISRELRRLRISERLRMRLDNGMVEEIQGLLNDGIEPENLIYYGLEYKFVTLYIIGKLSYKEMVNQLEIAIHQFAKRQMTWLRGMERRGITLHYIPYDTPPEEIAALFRFDKSDDVSGRKSFTLQKN